jgi:beta-lactamase superfamily II metal-dependent hydrolase
LGEWLYRTIHVSVALGAAGQSGSPGQAVLAELTQSKAIWIDTAQQPALGFGHKPG